MNRVTKRHFGTFLFRTDSTDSTPDCLPILLSLSVFTFYFCFFPAF